MDISLLLPNEIWDDILGYVKKHDLKNIRLTGRWHLGTLASPKLFTTAYIAARRGVIDALAGLANHSVLRHHVKVFILDSSYLDPEIHGEHSGDDWSKAIEAVHEDKLLAVAFANQEHIQTCELHPALEHAFESFPNIEKIVYAEMPRVACLPGDRPDICTSISDSDQPRLPRLLTGKFRKQVFPCCLAKKCGKKHSNFHRRQYGGLTSLLKALDSHELGSLNELSLGSDVAANYTAGIPNFFLHKDSETFYPLLNTVSGLRKLDITMSFPSLQLTSFPANAGQSTANLAHAFTGLQQMLGFAENLQELCLSGEMNVASLSLEHLWPDRALGSLKTLRLKTTEASFAKVSKLIWCNRHTLQHIQFDDFNLLTEGWPAISEFIKKHAPDVTVVYGYTWFQGITRSITWSPNVSSHAPAGDAVADQSDENDEDPADGSYSDGEDFVSTDIAVGYQRKTNLVGDPQTDDSEYEDVIKVVKELKDESDDESLEYDSDGKSIEYVSDDVEA